MIFNLTDEFDIAFAQVIGTKSANFDIISLFAYDNNGFKECRQNMVHSVRWFPFNGHKSDRTMTFGQYLPHEDSFVICPVVHFCVKFQKIGLSYKLYYDTVDISRNTVKFPISFAGVTSFER